MLIVEHPDVLIDITPTKSGTVLTYVHSTHTPPDEVLDAACDKAEDGTFDLKQVRLLVLTDGGAPSPVARKKMIQRLSKFVGNPRIAVVSDAAAVRFVVSTLLFFNPNAKVFSSRELQKALAFLEVGGDDGVRITSTLTVLRFKAGSGRFQTLDVAVKTAPAPASA